MGIDPCNDIYAIFSFESLPNLPFCISKLHYNCLIEMVFDETRVTHAVKITHGAPMKLKSIKRMINCALKKYLETFQLNSLRFCLREDFFKGSIQIRMSG